MEVLILTGLLGSMILCLLMSLKVEEPLARDFQRLSMEFDRLKERTDRVEETARREVSRRRNFESSVQDRSNLTMYSQNVARDALVHLLKNPLKEVD